MKVILDSEALSLLAAHDKRIYPLVVGAIFEQAEVCVPAVILAEVMTGKKSDAEIWHVLKKVSVTDTTTDIAARAGSLRNNATHTRPKKRDLTIDAIVAATAEFSAPAVIVTGDPGDLSRLVSHPHVRVEPVTQ